MTDFNQREQPSGAAAAAALLLAAAAGAVVFLLSTPQGKRLVEQFAGRTEDWKAQAASVLAESREKMVSSVETPQTSEQNGRLRENL
ncbi:MAG: hypothetical protein ACRYFS_19055 [Janthinobacterium lividum]